MKAILVLGLSAVAAFAATPPVPPNPYDRTSIVVPSNAAKQNLQKNDRTDSMVVEEGQLIPTFTNTVRDPVAGPVSLQYHCLTNLNAHTNGFNPTNAVWFVASSANGWATNPPCSPPWQSSCGTSLTLYGFYMTNLYVNPNYWLRSVPSHTAISGVPSYGIWYTNTNGLYYIPNATLITRRHAIRCRHGSGGPGTPFVFFDTNGTRHTRHAIDQEYVGWTNRNGGSDQKVYQLNEALPNSVIPMKLAPQSWTNLNTARVKAPLIAPNQYKLVGVSYDNYDFRWRSAYGIAGDSGSVSFHLVENELVVSPAYSHTNFIHFVHVLNARNGTAEVPKVFDDSNYYLEP